MKRIAVLVGVLALLCVASSAFSLELGGACGYAGWFSTDTSWQHSFPTLDASLMIGDNESVQAGLRVGLAHLDSGINDVYELAFLRIMVKAMGIRQYLELGGGLHLLDDSANTLDQRFGVMLGAGMLFPLGETVNLDIGVRLHKLFVDSDLYVVGVVSGLNFKL